MSAEQIIRRPNWSHDRMHFYKYVSRSTARTILEHNSLRWSTSHYFNDPFDIQFDLHVIVDRAAVKASVLEKLWDAHYGNNPKNPVNALGMLIAAFRGRFPKLSKEEFNREFGEAIEESLQKGEKNIPRHQEEIRRFMADTKVLCLSEISDNLLMWSHYAEKHAGLVLRLRCMSELDSAWGAAKPVQYLDQMPRLLDEGLLSNLMSGSHSLDHRAVMDTLVYTKAKDWAYEREWRLCSGAGRMRSEFEDLPFNPLELDGLIFGCQMPRNDREEFTHLIRARYPHATLYEAKKADREFRLNIVQS
jgi:hypothetical protein